MASTTNKEKDRANARTMAALIPFTGAAHEHTELAFDSGNVTPGATAQAMGPYDVPAYGFLRHVVLEVVASGGTGGTFTANGDAPFNILQSVQINDVNGAPIVGPFSGYTLYLANKYGVYSGRSDPATQPGFVGTTPNFAFALRLPIEINHNDGFGCLPNQNAAAPYRVAFTINSLSGVWSANPSPVPAVRVRGWLEAWTQPTAMDVMGRAQETAPPYLGTSQYWSNVPATTVLGQNNVLLRRVGNLLRTLILVARDNTGLRSNTVLPDPVEIRIDSRTMNFESLYYRRMVTQERIIGSSFAPAVQETGVLVYSYSHDNHGVSGDGSTELFLPTSQATRFEIVGANFGAAGSLDMIVNDVAPVEINPAMRYAERSASGFDPRSYPTLPATS